MTQRYMKRTDAADYVREQGIPCTKKTLAKLAHTGGGPIYRRFGNTTLYTTQHLDEWIDGKLSAPIRSTSDQKFPLHASEEGPKKHYEVSLPESLTSRKVSES